MATTKQESKHLHSAIKLMTLACDEISAAKKLMGDRERSDFEQDFVFYYDLRSVLHRFEGKVSFMEAPDA